MAPTFHLSGYWETLWRAWNKVEEKWYFATVDVIAVLAGSPNPQVCWRMMNKRLIEEGNQTVTNCNGLEK